MVSLSRTPVTAILPEDAPMAVTEKSVSVASPEKNTEIKIKI